MHKMNLRDGSISKNSPKPTDKLAVESNERRSKSILFLNIDNLKPSDLLKMITTPVEKQRAKSYFLGNKRHAI